MRSRLTAFGFAFVVVSAVSVVFVVVVVADMVERPFCIQLSMGIHFLRMWPPYNNVVIIARVEIFMSKLSLKYIEINIRNHLRINFKYFCHFIFHLHSLKTFSKSCSESDGSSLSIDEPDGCFTPDESNGFPVKTYK